MSTARDSATALGRCGIASREWVVLLPRCSLPQYERDKREGDSRAISRSRVGSAVGRWTESFSHGRLLFVFLFLKLFLDFKERAYRLSFLSLSFVLRRLNEGYLQGAAKKPQHTAEKGAGLSGAIEGRALPTGSLANEVNPERPLLCSSIIMQNNAGAIIKISFEIPISKS